MRLYFLGIGGVAMGNAALLMKQMGHEVLGSDGPLYPPMSDALKGLEIYNGYSAERLAKLTAEGKVDAIVIGNSIGRGNVELEWFWNNKPFPYYSLTQLLHDKILSKRKTIAVCGTHGKTTTTTLTAFLLQKYSENLKNKIENNEPGWLIGGVPQDLKNGANIGDEKAPFIIEGDEYDSAFFDKRAKFISYTPTVAVLNNLELDHIDIYRDIDDLKRSFNHMLRTVPGNGLIIANYDDENLRSILPVSWAPVLWVSTDENNKEKNNSQAELLIKNYHENSQGSSFDLFYKGVFWHHVTWKIGGIFNARNAAMAAIAAAWTTMPQSITQFDLSALKDFIGVKRRQEMHYHTKKLVVVEDFAHHPTAVRETLISLRNKFPGRRWIACLEPRSATSRTNAHQNTFPAALAHADVALMCPVHNAEKLAPEKRLNTPKVVEDIISLGKSAYALTSCSQIPLLLQELIQKEISSGHSCGVVFFSNGSFEGAMKNYLDSLSSTNSSTNSSANLSVRAV